MGLLHDIGKVSGEFQRYIRDNGPSPDHATAGAQVAAQRYGAVIGRLMAFGIAGHHSGLGDGAGSSASTLDSRLAKPVADYSGWEDHVADLPKRISIQLPHRAGNPRDPGFALAFLGRMLFSCLVDADFLATEHFYAGAKGQQVARGGHVSLGALRDRLDRALASIAERAPASPVNRLRAEILAHARAKAALPPGLFTMTVPTGGGKTFASLAFALDHAIAHRLDRVVYVIPYTSIIEQTADIFRQALGDDDVLEHHGNVDWERAAEGLDDEGRDGLHKLRRAAENWDVRIVVTTAVQFFESLYAARTSRCRKLHNLARSVIILDEAQTLPVPLLRPCMTAIDELAASYGASVVLCTATQPALRCQDGFKNGGLDIPDERELAPDPERLYNALKRVKIDHVRAVADADIAARFAEQPQMLCIVNSRKHAQGLHAQIAHLPGARHLTTLMCPAHRRLALGEIRVELKALRPARLVATSLIEAGVDVDFPEVWRAETGLDSIAQAAGRCNREGNLNVGRTIIFESVDHPAPRQFRQQIEAMHEALHHHKDDPLGLDAVRAYFRTLYWAKGPEALDAATLEGAPFPILATLKESFSSRTMRLSPPYASIARAFRIIEDRMDPVIIRWRGGGDPDEVDRLLAALRTADRPPGAVLRRLQQFTVTVPVKARLELLRTGAAQPVSPDYGDRFVVLEADSLYSESTGLSLDPFGMTAESGIL